MTTARSESNLPQWLIFVGAVVFILMLAVSAFWEASIRWLHFFQAWMYLATIVLSFRRSRWGYFIGLSAAGLWDYTNVFANTFLYNGIEQLMGWIHTGHLQRPDLLIAIPAWLANFLVVVGCVWGYLRLRDKYVADVGKFVRNVCTDHRIFCTRYLCVPAAIPWSVPKAVASAIAVAVYFDGMCSERLRKTVGSQAFH
jgi:hypothetical protein